MNILLVPNPDKDAGLAATRAAISAVAGRADLYVSDAFSGGGLDVTGLRPSGALYRDTDVILVLGGDGTLLGAARDTVGLGIPILGVNLGHLGFLAEVERQELARCVDRLFDGSYTVEDRMMLASYITHADGSTEHAHALNDFVITRAAFSRLIDLHLYVNDSYVDEYSADGMIVATPTGSTAYSLSAGGPIVDPAVEVMLMTPICPHKLYSRSVIIPAGKRITIKLGERCRGHKAMVTSDGQKSFDLDFTDTLTIEKSAHVTRLVKMRDDSFYAVLQSKMRGVT